MKRAVSVFLAVIMILSLAGVCSAAGDIVLMPSNVTEKNGVTVNDEGIRGIDRGKYFGFGEIDLTGIKSVEVNAYNKIVASSNGDTLLVIIDDPQKGDIIGTVTLTKYGEDITVKSELKQVTGIHKLYFRSLYARASYNETCVKKITLSKTAYKSDKADKKVPDSKVIDVYADTWAAVDDMGRSVADYEEVGPVKSGEHETGMLYWDWFGSSYETARATVISDIMNAHPEERENYASPVWDTQAMFYWAEPLLGFYNSFDYWVYRRHAEMLANAGIDAIFFDYSNGGLDYIRCLNALADAFRDAKASGIDAPKISAMTTLGGMYDDAFRGLLAMYYNCFVENDYSDIWYYLDSKPLMYANGTYENAIKSVDDNSQVEKDVLNGVKDFFTVRYQGGRNRASDGEIGSNAWMWLENFPQILRNPNEEGRPEFVVVGVGINQSTIYGLTQTGVFSDEYNKGRGYSEAFGEDYRDIGKRKAYFFREQAALALEADPEFLMIDGWNEWTAIRQADYNGFKNSFVDLFDDENSRDFEPSAGVLKDDYYNLLCDLVRKYKGVRPVPTASGMKTVDINADASAWDSVGPEFLNNNQDYERDSYGLSKAREIAGNTFEAWHYTTTVNNAISSAKVSFDTDNFYFMVKTVNDIKTGTDNWMHLYINTDRNRATGWEGYDFAVNIGGPGVVSRYDGAWSSVGTAEYTVTGNVLQLKLARGLIDETDTVDFEFKWTDSVATGNLLDFYKEGSSAPLGRFNYVYTEKTQTALTSSERNLLSGSAVLKAGANRMVVSGGKMYVYEADTRIAPFEANGTLYIPEETFNEVMGYGHTKTRYEAAFNMLLTYHYDLNGELTEIENYMWTYGTLGSNEVRVNGTVKYLSAAPVEKDGLIYIPLSMIAECYGWTLKSLGDGAYVISNGAVSETAVTSALSHIA